MLSLRCSAVSVEDVEVDELVVVLAFALCSSVPVTSTWWFRCSERFTLAFAGSRVNMAPPAACMLPCAAVPALPGVAAVLDELEDEDEPYSVFCEPVVILAFARTKRELATPLVPAVPGVVLPVPAVVSPLRAMSPERRHPVTVTVFLALSWVRVSVRSCWVCVCVVVVGVCGVWAATADAEMITAPQRQARCCLVTMPSWQMGFQRSDGPVKCRMRSTSGRCGTPRVPVRDAPSAQLHDIPRSRPLHGVDTSVGTSGAVPTFLPRTATASALLSWPLVQHTPPGHTVSEELRQEIEALSPWFHNMDLGGIETAPSHFLGDYPRQKWERFAHALPSDLTGRSVLDIGCNAGFYSLEMKRRGARRVLGVDHDERYLAQARLAARVKGLDVEFRRLSTYEVAKLGERFDLVLFMGLLYHLRHPLLALDLVREHVVNDLLVFQSMMRGERDVAALAPDYPFEERDVFARPGYPKLFFVERSYADDPTNWWVPNRACAEAMLRAAGFRILAHPEEEVLICRRDEDEAPWRRRELEDLRGSLGS